MEDAFELANYLPLSFKTPNEQEYVAFLWDAFKTNYQAEKYQFAFLAYHMLTMSLVYFKIWQIKHAWPEDFQKGIIGFDKETEKDLLDATTPFTFSKVPERRVLRFLKLIGCDNSKVGTYEELVKDRNEMAHSRGHIFVHTENMLKDKIRKVLKAANDIQIQSKTLVESCYREFLAHNLDPEVREYSDASDQIREVLIHSNYLSLKDIEICTRFDIQQLGGQHGLADMRALHHYLLADYNENGLSTA